MTIERKTKVQQGAGVLKTSIPAIISKKIGISKGTYLNWTIVDDKEIRLKKAD